MRSSDHDEGIRLVMVKYLVLILGQKWREEVLCEEATDALVGVIRSDPCVEVRLAGIHQICDLVHSQEGGAGGGSAGMIDASEGEKGTLTSDNTGGNGAFISSRLLEAVGNRVSSKHKIERRNSVTGLAHIFYRRHILDTLKLVQCGGDDCDITVIMNIIHETCAFGLSLESKGTRGGRPSSSGTGRGNTVYDEKDKELDKNEKYKFIPRLVFESACFTDATDPDMRNRVIQIVDDVLLGTGNANPKSQDGGVSKEPLTLTSRAVGLAIIINSLQAFDRKGTIGTDNSNAFKWMRSLLCQRAHLQYAVSSYVKARSATERCTQGSEERMAADAVAIEKLELVASLSAPLCQHSSPGSPPEDLPTVLNKFHTTRDKHIFRLLASVSLPNHSPIARARVFDDLPKRTSRLGLSTASWTKCLARRTAMGNFVNAEIITHCILLAQEAFRERDFKVAMVFLNCVKMTVAIFPILGGNTECFGTLVELFSECRGSRTSELKKEIEKSGIVTILSGILAAAASARSVKINKPTISSETSDGCVVGLEPDLQFELIRLCTKDGTPEQARHAVFTLAALTKKDANQIDSGVVDEKEKEIFTQVLKSLTSPSRLSISTNSKDNSKLVCALTTLTAIVECAPSIFCNGTRHERAIRFTLETVLLGRGHTDDASEEHRSDSETLDIEDEVNKSASGDDSNPRVSSSGRRSSTNGLGNSGNTMNDIPMILSVSCRRACAAMDFLVGHIRSTIIYSNQSKSRQGEKDKSLSVVGNSTKATCKATGDIKLPTSQHILSVFNILVNIIQDSGLPPSSRDRRECKGTKERAALRERATLNLLRLCDARLKLESKYLTPKMWHILGGCFLDEEKSVRENIMNELSMMLKGTGKYRDGSLGVAPSLRFLALTALCPDNDQHVQGNPTINGNAANVGRYSTNIKSAALMCISSLRQTCEATSVQCRAISRKAERNFDNNLKMKLMPEFALPFAFHILAFRPETPSTEGRLSSHGVTLTQQLIQKEHEHNRSNDEPHPSEEGQHKMLQKRLRWLLEPLVQSLGESADNISFLLRQAEILGNKFRPIEASQVVLSSPPFSPSKDSLDMLSPGSLELQTTPIKLPIPPDSVKRDELSMSKLKVICASARRVLLKFVKKDVNLTPYPGVMQIPSYLFARTTNRLEACQPKIEEQCKQKKHSSPGKKRKVMIVDTSVSTVGRGTKVQFLPDTGYTSKQEDEADVSLTSWDEAGGSSALSIGQTALFRKDEVKCLSPIPLSNSPSSSTPSSVITAGQDRGENEAGLVKEKKYDTMYESHTPNTNSVTSSSNRTNKISKTSERISDSQNKKFTALAVEDLHSPTKKRKKDKATDEKTKKKKSSPIRISNDRQRKGTKDLHSPTDLLASIKKRKRDKATDEKTKKKKTSPVRISVDRRTKGTTNIVQMSRRSRLSRTESDYFEFVDNDNIGASPAIEIKSGGQESNSSKKKVVHKPSKKIKSTTTKRRGQKVAPADPSQSSSGKNVTTGKRKSSRKEDNSLQQNHKKEKDPSKERKLKSPYSSGHSLDSESIGSSQYTRRRSPRNQSKGIAS